MLSRIADNPTVLKAMKRLETRLRCDPATLLTDGEVELFASILEAEGAAAFPGLSGAVSPCFDEESGTGRPLRARRYFFFRAYWKTVAPGPAECVQASS
jgi:hypothetical protein